MGAAPPPPNRATRSRPGAARSDLSQFCLLSGQVGPRLVQDTWVPRLLPAAIFGRLAEDALLQATRKPGVARERVGRSLSTPPPNVEEGRSCPGCESSSASSQVNRPRHVSAPVQVPSSMSSLVSWEVLPTK